MPDITALLTAHLRHLVEDIGERPGGSPANLAAMRYLVDTLAGAGWVVEEQRFAMTDWRDGGTTLSQDGRRLPAAANAYSPPCSVTAPLVPVGTLAELRAADLHGRVGLLYGDLVTAPLSPKAWFLISEREAEIITLLETQAPAALLTVQHIGGGLERLIEDWEFTIPSATVTAEAGRALLQSPDVPVALQISSRSTPSETGNVVGRGGDGQSRVVICAHHDTKFGTPGALDNASGTAVVLALAEILDPSRYPFAVELVIFANEEYMPIGDDEYLRRQGGDDLSDVLACINIDGCGLWIAPDSIAAISASEAFTVALHNLTAAFPAIVWTDPWPESNHSTFAFRGVPSVAFTSANRTALAHQPQDDLRWIDPVRLALLPTLISGILDLLARSDVPARAAP